MVSLFSLYTSLFEITDIPQAHTIGLILLGATLSLIIFMPEIYAPLIL